MKTKKSAAAAVGLLSAVTVLLCACSAKHEHTDVIYSSTESVQQNEGNVQTAQSVPESTSIGIDLPNVPTAPTPQKEFVYDDPDSYINYDPSTDTYHLTEEEEQIGKSSLFVGDSICLGFATWRVVESKNVYATGNVGARNLFDYEMYYRGRPEKFLNVLSKVKPEHIFFWMGMNDVNMTDSKEYCENYRTIIDTALQNSSADIYICAITPISRLEFTDPINIKKFNFAIKSFVQENYNERVHFIDFGEPLKNADGNLDEQYNGGDGIHLSRKAYYVAMHEICKQMKE